LLGEINIVGKWEWVVSWPQKAYMRFEFFTDGTYTYVSSAGAYKKAEYKVIDGKIITEPVIGSRFIIDDEQRITLYVRDAHGREQDTTFKRTNDWA